jgi:feruloyl esterase
MKKRSHALFALVLLAPTAWAAGSSCEDLTKLKLGNTHIDSATMVARGAFPAPPGQNGQVQPQAVAIFANTPAFCRVQVTLKPTSDSDIKVEVWLPQDNFSGRLQAIGNGGFGSSIGLANLAQGVTEGFAMVGSNTGHDGNSGAVMIGHPEKFKDWGYRAMHEMTVTAKALVKARYGNPAKYSYYAGCSTGGRQGWIAAQYYPADFDGLVIGDAANPMTRNQASTIYGNLVINKDAASVIPMAKWTAYHNAVMAKCDAADGVKDGILNNPLACDFAPQDMQCKGGDNDSCLTEAQVASMTKLMAGMKNPRTGEQLRAGWPVGTIPANFVIGPKPEDVAVDTFRILFNDANWDYHTMDFDKDIAKADKLGANLIDAANPSKLSKLFARGGKIFYYHGWNDPAITPLSAIDYYNAAVKANGGRSKTDNSLRLFMVPGMNHCGGGDGPNTWDKLDVIVNWVEHGKAPDRVVASHSTNGKVDRTRPLCPYPQVAKYAGFGNTDEAANFSCAAP